MLRTLVLKVSGKFISPYDTPLVERYAAVLEELRKRYKLAVVVGGGSVARKYIDLAPPSKGLKDIIGIEVSRLNAKLLAMHTPSAKKVIPKSASEVLELWDGESILLVGGLQPGQSTNAVALVVAELVGADIVVNATTVDAVYDKPPSQPGARKIKKIKAKELQRLLEGLDWRNEPGRYELMDSVALQIAERSGIPIAVIYGGEPERIPSIVNRGEWGTLVLP